MLRSEERGGSAHLLLVYGLVEASIGAYVLAFPSLFELVRGLSFSIPHASAGIGFGVDAGLAALLIGLPAILMGGTIPILTRALARSLDDATRLHAYVYAANAGGAFLGALAAGLILIPALGLVRLMYLTSVTICSLCVFLLPRIPRPLLLWNQWALAATVGGLFLVLEDAP